MAKVDQRGSDECWPWTGWHASGYPVIDVSRPRRRKRGAHVVVYELLVGPVPDGLELDHLCRNIGCVNPAHLEPVTHAENVRRGHAGRVNATRQQAKTHCPAGHPYDAANTAIGTRGERKCRACHRERARERRRRGLT